ncbi:GntR family transcriptional regulator [Actinomycetaceae bacterium L2_0104]
MNIDESRPIWLQLVEEFQRRIAVGEWAAGTKIPSVRELAMDIGVNPNTVQRAFSETDRLGLTVPMRTAGRYVTDDSDVIGGARSEMAEATIDGFIDVVVGIGMDLDETIAALADRWPEASSIITAEQKDER